MRKLFNKKLLRRVALTSGGALLLAIVTCSCLTSKVGGDFRHPPQEWQSALSPAARALIDRSFADLTAPRVDYHTHLVGMGDSGSGAWVNPKMQSWLHPILRVKFSIYMSATGVDDLERVDAQYLDRLVALATHGPGPARHALFAFERNYWPDGNVNLDESEFHVPNDYVFDVVKRHPQLFVPVASIHPYRRDAIAELDRCAAQGVRLIKWLPAAMGMDPADPACDPFYDRMRELGIALVCHAGKEMAVDAEEAQRLGNPLRLRRPLDRGVKVIVAHCATLGEDEDLDDPARPDARSFDLFLRMMDEPRYRGLLFGEISAVTQINRGLEAIATLLAREDLHSRLVNGSDYPIPAINILIWTGRFESNGFMTEEEVDLLDEIYGVNPILFDYVLKRCLRHPKTGARFPAALFQAHPQLPVE